MLRFFRQTFPRTRGGDPAYARVGRGDVRGCSFGFDIRAMEESWDEDGTYRTRLTDVDLFEVSPCTFPAYKQTTVSARSAENILTEQKKEKKNGGRKCWPG